MKGLPNPAPEYAHRNTEVFRDMSVLEPLYTFFFFFFLVAWKNVFKMASPSLQMNNVNMQRKTIQCIYRRMGYKMLAYVRKYALE